MEEKCGRTIDAGRQLDYRRMVERLGDRRTSRHCFFFIYSVRAGGGCGNSLPNEHAKKARKTNKQNMHQIKPIERNETRHVDILETVKNGNADTDGAVVKQSNQSISVCVDN